MDDQVLVEPGLGVRRFLSGRLADEISRGMLGEAAINDEKNAVEGAGKENIQFVYNYNHYHCLCLGVRASDRD